jgi:polysaccharide export outer membrane protein
MKKIIYSSLLLAYLGSSCTPCGYKYRMEGAQEFVLDSYRIQQGKFSILELEGVPVFPFPCCYLEEYEDIIDEDDVLKIAIFHPSRVDLMLAVNAVGETVGYRVINGAIRIPGLLLYNREIVNVEVFIEYRERLHSKVDLIGSLGVSEVPVNGRIRLYEVLSIAKIPPNANLFKSYVVREGCILPIDLYKLVHEGDMSQNIVMRPKDKIYIADPMASTVMVMGEVGFAQVIPVPAGSISLREAIAAAGGIPFTGDKRCIQVIRGNIINPKIYKLSWNHIAYLPNESLLLMPGDTVYISERPITKWNRFIEQLLPSSLLIDLGIKTKGFLH